jgi:hypothetical protein
MGRINIGRVILGGIVAGIVMDLLGYLVDGLMLAQKWSDDMILLGRSEFSTTQLIEFNLLGIVSGLVAIWIYAGIRPRFGAGMMTAIYAGIAVWVLGVLLPNASFMYVTRLFSRSLTLYTTLGGLVEVVVGTIAGAALYQEG